MGSDETPAERISFMGRYRLVRKIAQGGMGSVYAAEDTATGRAIAIKILSVEFSQDEELHRRFRREASVLAALEHPNVVRVLDYGTDEKGRAFTVMELLRGETLRERIVRTPRLPLDVVRVIVQGIANGLAAVHDHGVIHGDIKPENVFLTGAASNDVRLVDFGLSKVHGLDRLTKTGEVLGTPIYMAPELLTGRGEVDETIDTYSLGVLVYECLAGHAPFEAKHPGQLLIQIASGNKRSLADSRPDIGVRVVEFVDRAMNAQRALRFATAADFATAMDTL